MVQDINKVTEPFSKQENYSKDELADVWNNEVSNNNFDAYYDNNGNIGSYIAIEEEGRDIVVNQYDNQDNIVRSAVIPSDNGRYNSEDVRDTILKVASNTDLNPYIQEMATNFQDDLANTLPGERYKAGDTWTGQKRATTKELADIKDETGASWNKIGEVLDDIANGRKNNTKLARAIENKLDEALSEGYTNIYGKVVNPNEEYLEQKSKVYGRDFTQNNNDYNPTENMTEDDYRIFGMKKNRKTNAKNNEVKNAKKKTSNTKNNIQDDIENFSNQVDAVLNGTFPKRSMLTILRETPKPLQDIGLPNLPITMTQRHLDTILNETGKDKNANYHNLGVETIKQLPVAISNPLDIVMSNTRGDSIVLTTYLADKENRTIVASIKIDGKGLVNNILIDTNVMTSAYGRNNYEAWMDKNLKEGKLLYDIDRGVIKKVDVARLQLPRSTNSTTKNNGSISTNSIPQNASNVKKNTATNQSMQNTENNAQEQKKIQKELHNRISNALLSRNSRKNTYLGTVSNKVVNKVKSLLGIDISNRTHLIADNDIRHMIKQHGNPEIEKARGQIAITSKDIERIPEILNTYDRIIKGTDNKQGQTIRYIKDYPNNQTYVVEVIPTANDTTLYVKTMWKKAINNKKEAVALTNSKNAPSSTSKTRGNLASNNSIPQNSKNVKDDGVRSMKKNTSKSNIAVDNQGRTLTKQQQEYFKNSKVRDENGNLLVMYHGTEANVGIPETSWFTIFDIDKAGNHGSMLGDGFYFTSDKSHAEQYAHTRGNIYETYLNIENPLELDYFSTGELAYAIRKINPYIEADIYKRDGTIDGYKVRRYLLDNGYDGIHSGNTYVAFNSNQIKNVTNKTPTPNKDIRFAKKTAKTPKVDGDILEPGKTNAQRASNYIEQEIRKIEETGNWDDTIPVTKMTDIRKTIENYLGIGVQRGHFRQQAYGIYKGNRDVIRTKELKDIDTILHETGHALDIGKRIKLDKESISNELLTAVKKYGGYEAETRQVQLEEGFAEVIREYSIVPEQAKIDYPQTVAILEGIRQTDKDFNNFITTVQQQTYNYQFWFKTLI